MAKKPTKATARKKTKNKKTLSKRKKSLLYFLLKVGFTAFCLIAFYGIYLDGKIRSKMDGQIWKLPAEVYSRIPYIRTQDNLTLTKVKQQLLENNYRQTLSVVNPGDFKIEGNTLLLLRRAFPFPNQMEAQKLFRLHFRQNKLDTIEDLVDAKVTDNFPLAPKLIAVLQSENEERLAIPLQQFPRLLIDTLLLTEDRNFFHHDGISPLGIARAMITNIRAGHKVQGGSTLTQQLVKNLFLTNQRSFRRKFNEALMALILDYRYDKNRILETYLNEVYLGQMGNAQINGFALASLFYFGRPIREISLDQMALLVGMVKGPSLYNPWRRPQLTLERRNVILRIMRDHNVINNSLYQMLLKRPLGVQAKGQIAQKYPAFMHTLRKELHYRLGAKDISSLSGTRIFSTLDPYQQKAAEEAVIQRVASLRNQTHNNQLESAMVISDYRNGEIRAMIGGFQTQYAGYNRAIQARRQIGSLVKPAIYLSALTEPNRFALNSWLNNQPITIRQKGSPPWSPKNYNHQYGAPLLLVEALTKSMNIPTVNLGLKVGLEKIINTQKVMGWDKVDIPKVPAMLLGSYTISPYDVTKLFQTLANNGRRIPLATLNTITDLQGNILYQRPLEPQQVVPSQAAFLTLFAMQQVVKNGTARRLQSDYSHLHLAGKTGTTNDARDTWFVGIDGENVTTVWLGRDDNGKTRLTGSSGTLRVYQSYLQRANVAPLVLRQPRDIQWAGIEPQGRWNCNLYPKYPVWTNNPNFCQEGQARSRKKSSIWDFFK